MTWQTNGYMDYKKVELDQEQTESRNMAELLSEREIRKMVYTKYPITPKEQQGCIAEKMNNTYLRNQYKKQLLAEGKEKKRFNE